MKCGSMFSVYIWAEHRFRIELVPDGLNIIPSRMRVSTKITTSTPVVIAMPWAINLRISLPFDRIPIMHRHIWYSPFWAVCLYRSRRSKQTNHQVVSTSTLFMRCIVVPNQHLLFFFSELLFWLWKSNYEAWTTFIMIKGFIEMLAVFLFRYQIKIDCGLWISEKWWV